MAGVGGQEEGVFGKLRRALGRTKGLSSEEATAKESEARLQALDAYIKRMKSDKVAQTGGIGGVGNSL